MKNKVLLLLILFLFGASTSFAQYPKAKIVDPGQTYSTYNLEDDYDARSAILDAVGSQSKLNEIIKMATEDTWPSGMDELDDRLENRELFKMYRARLIARFDEKVLVKIGKYENQFMEYKMRPQKDFYIVLAEEGVVLYEDFPLVEIVDPGETYSTYDLSTKEAFKSAILKDVTEDFLEEIIAVGNEDSWPSGMDELDDRLDNRSEFKKYKARLITRYDDKAIIMIGSWENQFMPSYMKQNKDFFIVIGEEGISTSGGAVSGTGVSGMIKVSIVDPGKTYATYTLDDEEENMQEIRDQGVSYSELQTIMKMAHEDMWPDGIDDLDDFFDNIEQIKRYKAYLVATFDGKSIIKIPAKENSFMPSYMKIQKDFYMIILNAGIDLGIYYSPMKITDPGKLYSTYGLDTKYEAQKEILEEVGSKAILYEIIHLCQEDNWPEGINTLDERLEKRAQMRDYKAYKVAEFSGKYVLKIPASKNKHMPKDMQPYSDFYFIIGKEGVIYK